MLQKNHPFFFAQIYFGSFRDLQEEWRDEKDCEIDLQDPWTLLLEANEANPFQQKIELFINWTDQLS